MSRELFGTDGVRGLAGSWPLDKSGAQSIGRAVGTRFGKSGETIVIGCDPRESSAELVKNVSAGIMQTGVNVVFIGVLPTPGLAYVTREGDYVAGVMITASHNPLEYNGVKVFDSHGDKLTDAAEASLNELIENGVQASGQAEQRQQTELSKTYEDFLVSSVGEFKLSGTKIVLDSANGAASGLAERVFSRLGADVILLFDKPNGQNINDGCGATNPQAVREEVLSKHLDLGIAFDGDADRVVMIDERGREIRGDYIMYILAVTAKLVGVVATDMSNQGLENSLKKKGIDLKRTKVGDRYVLEGLKQTGYTLGGEQSGHIILYNLLATGDGLLAALQTVKAVAESGKSLASWVDEVEMLPQATVNFDLADKSRLDLPEVKAYIKEQTEQLNGIGRLIVRPSGTEPLARVMVEAPDAETRANTITAKLKELLS